MSHDPIRALGALLDRIGIPYALIGGHAVNTLLEPRLTRDIDVTVVADSAAFERLAAALAAEGFEPDAVHGAGLASGPDFRRFVAQPVVVEIQSAKTGFQREVVSRADLRDGVRVATAEDLIVLKLIADRPKDRDDLRGLVSLPSLDWDYVERWAAQWEVGERLRAARSGDA